MDTLEQKELAQKDFQELLKRVKEAQKIYATYSQEQVDKIFRAAAIAANKNRILLAKEAVQETGMGVFEDKVIKNHYAAEYIYHAYKDTKTCGVIEQDDAMGYEVVLEPLGSRYCTDHQADLYSNFQIALGVEDKKCDHFLSAS